MSLNKRKGSRRAQRRVGDVVRVDLPDGSHTYARVLVPPYLAFYDARATADLSVEEVVTRPILFTICVMDSAVTSGRWPVVGNLPLEGALVEPPPQFVQDIGDPRQIALVDSRGGQRPATREEAAPFERLSVWSAEHVEDRLADHFAGRPNKWVESLKLKE